jgi:hypothetical protein
MDLAGGEQPLLFGGDHLHGTKELLLQVLHFGFADGLEEVDEVRTGAADRSEA